MRRKKTSEAEEVRAVEETNGVRFESTSFALEEGPGLDGAHGRCLEPNEQSRDLASLEPLPDAEKIPSLHPEPLLAPSLLKSRDE
jgi:hypothetical protein